MYTIFSAYKFVIFPILTSLCVVPYYKELKTDDKVDAKMKGTAKIKFNQCRFLSPREEQGMKISCIQFSDPHVIISTWNYIYAIMCVFIEVTPGLLWIITEDSSNIHHTVLCVR